MNFSDMLKLPIAECENFVWSEALWLNAWAIHALPSSAIEKNIIETARRMTSIREILRQPIGITSWYRPESYNRAIGGALRSQHLLGRACDFQVHGVTADDVRSLLLPHLTEINIRMENLRGADWVHIDTACVRTDTLKTRYFLP